MKKTIFFFLIVGVLVACNNNSTEEKPETATKDNSGNPDYQKGLALVAKNKCLTCHAIDDKVTGPPYREVANKYANYPDTIVAHLAHKIITGGNGVWGDVFMTPHPDLSREDAEAMVKYIRLLKK